MIASIRDVIQPKKIAKALQETKERYRHLLESTSAIPWEADAKTWVFTYIGPQAVKLLGYPLEHWLEEDFWVNHLHPEDREWAIDYCLKSAAQRDNYEFEYRMIAADGRSVWLHDIVNVVRQNGEPVALRGFMIDITERKRAEQEIAEKSALLETTLEKMSHGITVYDRNLDLLAFNERYVDLWDYPAGFIRLGMPFEEVARFGAQRGDYGPGDVEELVRQRVETRRRGEVYRYERVMSNGTIVAINREAMPDGGTVKTYTDITER
ncbi:MAG: PAS-domain containing protein, partial [Proteobacteria bacterium]|nr:PAS-domain containing protein [Pseudomonadota bacterium]